MTALPTDFPITSNSVDNDKRVLFITRKWGPAVGGMETYCERLTQELAKLQPVDVIALKGRDNGQPPSALALLLFPFTVLMRLFAIKDKPAIVHCGDMAIWPLGVLARLFFPAAQVMISAHGTDVSYGARGGVRGRLYSAYLRLGSAALSRSGVIANSRATATRLRAIGWDAKAVVPLATDLRSNAKADVDPCSILFVGRLITQKGCGWFVREVMPLLPQSMHLTIIGTRWDKSEDLVLDNHRVTYLGPKLQHELPHHIASAACVVVPNIERANGEFEGFGLVAPEAASVGGVVVASATGGLRDAVIDGETGFLVEPGNAQAWADTIRDIAHWEEDERDEFINRSQTKAREHFSWSRVAKQTAEAYRRCM